MNKELTQLASIHYGKSPNSTRVEESTIPIIGTGGRTGWAANSLFDGPATVVGRKGTLGNPLYVETPFWPIDTTYAVLPHKNIHAKWLHYSLADYDLEKLNEATGVPSINRDYLGRIKINFVEFPQQRKIAKILTTVDKQIEKTEELIAKYESVKQGMMQDLFTRGVDEKGKLRPKREEAPELYKKTELGWVPREWEVKPIVYFASKTSGATAIGPFGSDLVAKDYRDSGVPVVFVRDIKPNYFNWKSNVFVDQAKASKLSAHSVKPKDVLATKMGLPPCISCLYPNNMATGIITADVVRLRPDLTKTEPIWLTYIINNDIIKKQVLAITAGVTRPKITLKDFRQLRLAAPQLEEQKQISTILNLFQKKESAEKEELHKLKNLKTALMQDLLTGKVEVTPDPEDN